MPSSRELQEYHHASPVTISRAVAQLVAEGLLVTRPGSGTYVAARRSEHPVAPDLAWQSLALADRPVDTRPFEDESQVVGDATLVLDGGYVTSALQPTSALGTAMGRAARRLDVWGRAPARGLTTLRTYFANGTAGDVAADDVLVTSGGQRGISLVLRAVARPGRPVLVEAPTYPGALAAVRAAGLRPVAVPMDEEGVRPDLLAVAFEMTGARAVYCQPTHHNPTGATMSTERRRAVVQIARAANAFVVEDDYARLLSHGPEHPPQLTAFDPDGTVILVTSLTKPAAPSLRVAAVVARGPVGERLRRIQHVEDLFVSRVLQAAAVELVGSPAWNRHLRSLARALGERCEVLGTAVRRDLPTWSVTTPRGGLHLWAELPHGTDVDALAARARDHGVQVASGSRFFAEESHGPHLRLAFGTAPEVGHLVEVVARLAGAGS